DGNFAELLPDLQEELSTTGVIIVTGEFSPQTKVSLIEQYADDYLTKPFLIEELRARVVAVIRRRRGNPSNIFKRGNFSYNLSSGEIFYNDTFLDLRPKERSILENLLLQA